MARSPSGTRKTRLLLAAAITGTVVVLIVAIGIYGLIIGPPERGTDQAPPPSTSQSPQASPRAVQPVPATNDADEFATGVAHSLFTWDTHTTLLPNDYRQALLEVADPTGEETNGLVSDLENYLPDQETWTRLQEYQTRQWLEIDEVYVPDAWEEAVAVGGDELAEGTIAYTVTGTRHREGVWYGQQEASAHQVAFTVFLTCPPDGQDCYLLRLSVLDQPLR